MARTNHILTGIYWTEGYLQGFISKWLRQ